MSSTSVAAALGGADVLQERISAPMVFRFVPVTAITPLFEYIDIRRLRQLRKVDINGREHAVELDENLIFEKSTRKRRPVLQDDELLRVALEEAEKAGEMTRDLLMADDDVSENKAANRQLTAATRKRIVERMLQQTDNTQLIGSSFELQMPLGFDASKRNNKCHGFSLLESA